MGRKSKKNVVLNNISLIKDLKAQGATDLQIAKHLGVCPATWYKILKENPELQQAVDDGKKELASDLVGDLVKLAKGGYILTTTRTTEKNGEITVETTEKTTSPNLGAIIFLLKNLAPENWSNEPNQLELKKKELELKEKALENSLF